MQRKNLASKIACVLISASMLVSTTMTALATDGEVYVAEQAEVQAVSETVEDVATEASNEEATTESENTEEESATEEEIVADADVTIDAVAEEAEELQVLDNNAEAAIAVVDEEDGIALAAAGSEQQVAGTNVCYYYDNANKILTIYSKSSKGEAIPDYSNSKKAPWNGQATNVEKIVIGKNITGIGDCNFINFTALKSVALTDTVVSIGVSAFDGATNLNDINLGNVKAIGAGAFYNDKSLANVDLSNVEAVGEWAFRDSGITSATLKSGNVEIGEYAFAGSKLKQFAVGGISSWGNYSFTGCTDLESFTCGGAVTSVPDYTFWQCAALTSCSVKGATTVGTGAFSGCTKLASCEISDVEKIGKEAFYNCNALKAFDFSKVNFIGENAIYGTAIESIEFGRVEIAVDVKGFNGANSLTSICYPGTTAQWNTYIGTDRINENDFDAVVHRTESAVAPKKATCSTTGLEVAGTCAKHGEYSYDNDQHVIGIDADAHVWKEDYTVDTPATCEEAGSKSIHCKLCDAINKDSVEEIAATGHTWGEWETMTEASCTEDGEKKRTCSVCKKEETEVIKATGHSVTDTGWTVVEQATCDEEGESTQVCSVCKATVTRVDDPLGHAYSDEFTTDKEPTCIEKGSKSHHCTRTGCDSKADVTEIPANGHDYPDKYTVVKAATCEEEGLQTRTCEICKFVEETVVEKLGHKYSEEFTTDEEPTCTAEGSKSHHCTRLGCDSKIDVTKIPENGHDYPDKYTVVKAATCEEEGLQTRTCATCGYVEETTTAKLGHKYSEEFTTDEEPTCTAKGSKSHHCVRYNECGSKADVTDIDPTGHDYPDTWTTVEAATCTKDGELSRTCKTCGNVETKVAEALGHKYSDTFTVDKAATCTAEGSKSHHCVRCEDKIDVTVIPANGHSWGQWTTYSAPTVFKEEVQQHTCSVCSKTETSALAGTKLTPTMSVNASKVWLQIGQKTSAFKVSGLANGDSIKSYKSSNANIFTVTRKGVLKAGKNVGTAKLTITLASGVKKVIPVTVQKRQVKTWNIKNLPAKITIKKGSKYKLSPVISLITATSKFTYQSSNKKVATVTKAGKIKALKKGKAVITVKAGTVTKKVKVTVK